MTTKRIFGWLIALTALFAIGFTAVTYAQSNMPHAMMINGMAPIINQNGDFIDEDGDGVCDNYADGQMGHDQMMQMHQGQMGHGQMMQMHQGQMGQGQMMSQHQGQMGQGQMMSQHQGQMGQGQHFIDENGDGVCDYMTPTE